MTTLPLTRRQLLQRTGCGFGHLALLGMLGTPASCGAQRAPAANPLADKTPDFAPRAKRVIFLFMHGGVSQVDSFDPKPVLSKLDGQPLPQSWIQSAVPFGQNLKKDKPLPLLRSPWSFHPHGESGVEVSTLFPHIAGAIDDICVVRSMSHDSVSHAPAMQEIHTGSGVFKRPSAGSWILYGLGSENQNLPGFITICPPTLDSGTHNFGPAFLPASYQGTPLGETSGRGRKDDARRAGFTDLYPADDRLLQRLELDFVQAKNRRHLETAGRNTQLEARIASFELAFRMQAEAPEAVDLSLETSETLALYGVNREPTDNFARQCLLARRFAERGVRFIQATHSYKWDQHGGLKRLHARNAHEVDQPIAALLADLKRRGLLDDTIVLWGTEFGRTPVAEGQDGRDHNPYGFTIWLAGGGIKGGTTYGATDEVGFFAVENKLTIHDVYATVLHLLGLDHASLTYPFSGRDFRLTDVEGDVVRKIIS